VYQCLLWQAFCDVYFTAQAGEARVGKVWFYESITPTTQAMKEGKNNRYDKTKSK
jgi:predicted secreted protein